MKILTQLRVPLLCSALLISPAAVLAAGTLVGQIGVQVTIGSACTVGNSSSTAGVNNWGTINFGTYGDLTNAINGSILGSNGSSTVTITCSTGLTPTLTLNAGANAGSAGVRYMSNGTNTIGYRLYSDTARATLIAIDTPITLANSVQNIPVYGRILPADQTSTTPAQGLYQDTVIATLVW